MTKHSPYNDLVHDSTTDYLLELATRAAERAYAPYSKFHVGAAVLTASGQVYSGANVENASYSITSCAETSAISDMVSSGDLEIVEVVVVGPGPDGATPCGRCRQALREFTTSPDVRIHVASPGQLQASFTIGELLPHSFGPENLS